MTEDDRAELDTGTGQPDFEEGWSIRQVILLIMILLVVLGIWEVVQLV